jgi:RNA methyltransferase, TrmH family
MDHLPRITSRSNPRVAHFRKVRDGKIRENIFLEGVRLAEEALRSQVTLLEAIAADDAPSDRRTAKLLKDLKERGVRVSFAPPELLRALSDTVNPQGIALLAERPETSIELLEQVCRATPDPLIAVYFEISDPSNLGAVCRTAEAAGVSFLVVSQNSADPFSPKSNRAAMGSNLRLPILKDAQITDLMKWLRREGLTIAAADISGTISYTSLDLKCGSAIIFGSEAHGLPVDLLSHADQVFSIPMKNGVESLNLAVASGVVLFEAARQRASI